LASASRQRAAVEFALAVGPFPALDPGSADPGRVWFGLATPEGVSQMSATFAGHPSILKPRAAKQALNFLRLKLIGG
jgi:nicotinamide-nucleotide amidase